MNDSTILVPSAAGGRGGQTGRHVSEMLHLSQLWRAIRTFDRPDAARFAVTDTIEKLGGAKPKTFEAFVREEQNALTTA